MFARISSKIIYGKMIGDKMIGGKIIWVWIFSYDIIIRINNALREYFSKNESIFWNL